VAGIVAIVIAILTALGHERRGVDFVQSARQAGTRAQGPVLS
jgi:hypothetical protein